MTEQVATDVPEQRHVRIEQEHHVQVLFNVSAGPRQSLGVLVRGLLELHHQLVSIVVYVWNAPGFQAKVVLCMNHRRLVLVRLHRYNLEGGAGIGRMGFVQRLSKSRG